MDRGIYIHIPFCKQKCRYCDFNSGVEDEYVIQNYVETLKKEIILQGKKFGEKEYSSIFLGGGTPSLLSSNQILSIFEYLYKNFNIKSDSEITIEANPGTLNEEKLKAYKKVGINRLSMGLQSTQNELLKYLGRIHNFEDFKQNYYLARKLGFENINCDLMFAIPNQTYEDSMKSLRTIMDLNLDHISLYSLIIEEGTVFSKWLQEGKLNLWDEETDRKFYYNARNEMLKNNYFQYEISNFSKINKKSKHNCIYWNYGEYLGMGVSAHSLMNLNRFENPKSIKIYKDKIEKGILATENKNALSLKDQIEERMFLGLRMNEGVNLDEISFILKVDLNKIYMKKIERLIAEGYLEISDKNVKLTNKGIDLSNQVFCEFLLEDF